MSHTISAHELLELVQSGRTIELIDVRTPVEYREAHLTMARNIPLDQLEASSFARGRNPDQPVYVICRSGSRGRHATTKLIQAGLTAVWNVEGGLAACEEVGLPIAKGKRAISLERQVRIAAGVLLLVGAILGAFVSPYWIGLSAFVGAGLIFAGITDTCGMALLLARMPWNQVNRANTSEADPSASSLNGSASMCCSINPLDRQTA